MHVLTDFDQFGEWSFQVPNAKSTWATFHKVIEIFLEVSGSAKNHVGGAFPSWNGKFSDQERVENMLEFRPGVPEK